MSADGMLPVKHRQDETVGASNASLPGASRGAIRSLPAKDHRAPTFPTKNEKARAIDFRAAVCGCSFRRKLSLHSGGGETTIV
jgi:hypothetical protein